jgi:hypothetical protein
MILAVGLGLVWWSRQAQRHFDQQLAALRHQWESSPVRSVQATGEPVRRATEEVDRHPTESPPPSAAPGPEALRPPGVFQGFWRALVKVFRPDPPPTLTFETRGQWCRVEPTLLEPHTSWGTPGLVQHSQDCVQIVPGANNSSGAVFVGVLFPLGLWMLTWITLIGAEPWPHPQTVRFCTILIPLMQLGAIGFALLGLAHGTRRTWIHRGTGEVRRTWFFREQVLCRIDDVLAVQVVRQVPRRRGVSQVNLVLGPPSRARVNLFTHESGDSREQDTVLFGRRLAVFLEVPLVDQIEAMAVRTPAELASFFAPDWLAGPDNVKLIKRGAGVFELQHIPLRGAPPLVDPLGGGGFQRPCAAVTFDRNRGRRPRLFVHTLAGPGNGRLPDALLRPRPLQDVIAVELAADTGPALEAPLGPTCSLRLRLRDDSYPILELAPHAQQGWARGMGAHLAWFLGVPLEDRLGPEPS